MVGYKKSNQKKLRLAEEITRKGSTLCQIQVKTLFEYLLTVQWYNTAVGNNNNRKQLTWVFP